MKDNHKADVSHTDEFDKMYQEMVKQVEVKAFAAKVLKIKEEILIPDNYEVWDDKGNVIRTSKIIIREKKKEYPKTFRECQKYLGEDVPPMEEPVSKTHRRRQVHLLEVLLICRDAYWKIAGEEMGLGKPWEPDWGKSACYTICYDTNRIVFRINKFRNDILAFPTEEIRDAFYENFKSEIEQCKELL